MEMTLLVSGALALLTHAVFHTFEPRRPLLPVTATLILLPLFGAIVEGDISLWTVLSSFITYAGVLGVSIAVYRLSPLHPLASYPGPLLFKISKLTGTVVSGTGRQHLILRSLHDTYGPVVRIGPNELSIADADAIPTVLGPGGLSKGRYYDARRDPNAPSNLLAMTPGEMHTKRRRLWNRGLGNEALKEYEDIIAKCANDLARGLEKQRGSVDIVAWLNYFTFDFMGDMMFGEGYGMLHAGADKAQYWKVLEGFAVSAAMASHTPWAMPLLQKIPLVSNNLLKLRKLGIDSAMARIKRGSRSKDLWYHLADEPGLDPEKPELREVVADGALAIIAGADTTASAMSSLIFLLLSNPTTLRRLQEEIDHVYPDPNYVLDSSKHGELKYLSACINEALRLYPPVPTGGPREVVKGSRGRVIAGRFVPEGTQIYIPPYVVQRDSRYYPDSPDSFMPERWLSLQDPPAAFIPFSYGPSNCAGRHLARREMLMVMAVLVRKFNMTFAEGSDWKKWPSTLHDFFVSSRGPLLVELNAR